MTDKSIEEYIKAAENNPRNPQAFLELARAYIKYGEEEKIHYSSQTVYIDKSFLF